MSNLEERVAQLESFLGLNKGGHPYEVLAEKMGLKTPSMKPEIPKERYMGGIYPGIVVDTKDPYARGRVKVYVHVLHSTIQIEQKDLPWAMVLSWGGSLDDEGATFTPPAGSSVIVGFAYGDRDNPFVLGTFPHQSRGKYYPVEEEIERWGAFGVGRRGVGHLVGAEDHLLPPWNNESYNTEDLDQKTVNADGSSVTMPHIYGYKSPEGHFLRFDDGIFEDNLVNKSVILQTSKGSVLFMKDDATTSADDYYAHPRKDEDEERYPGARASNRTAWNTHRIELPQTGIQMQSFGGHRLIFDDSLSSADKDNQWTAKYGGASKAFKGHIKLQSISEHQIILRDNERIKGMRSALDGIFLQTATGNNIELCDDTIGFKAGPRRGIRAQTTSNHTFEMLDTGGGAISPLRRATNSALQSLPAAIKTPATSFIKELAPPGTEDLVAAALGVMDVFATANGAIADAALAGEMLAAAADGLDLGGLTNMAIDAGVEAGAAAVLAAGVNGLNTGGVGDALSALQTAGTGGLGATDLGNPPSDPLSAIEQAVGSGAMETVTGMIPGDAPGGDALFGPELVNSVVNDTATSALSSDSVLAATPAGTILQTADNIQAVASGEMSPEEFAVRGAIAYATGGAGGPIVQDALADQALGMMNSAELSNPVSTGGAGEYSGLSSDFNPNEVVVDAGASPGITGNADVNPASAISGINIGGLDASIISDGNGITGQGPLYTDDVLRGDGI